MGTDSVTGKDGYWKEEAGTDVFHPFSSGAPEFIGSVNGQSGATASINIAELYPNDYQRFTDDNFHIELNNATINSHGKSIILTVNKDGNMSYNASTGILSFTNLRTQNDAGVAYVNLDVYLWDFS